MLFSVVCGDVDVTLERKPAGNRYLLCECAMLCRAMDAVRSENNTAGFELPIRFSGF